MNYELPIYEQDVILRNFINLGIAELEAILVLNIRNAHFGLLAIFIILLES